MKARDALALFDALESLKRTPASVKFNYASSLNRKLLQPTVEALREARTLPPELEAFEKERQTIVRKHMRIDVPVTDGQIAVKNVTTFNADMAALNEKFPGESKDIEVRDAQVRSLLEGDVVVTLHRVVLNDMPEQLPGGVFDTLMDMVNPPPALVGGRPSGTAS